jgi:GxxExxY protein
MAYDEEIPPYGNLREPPPELNAAAHRFIGAAIEVHRVLGPGLPEEAYQRATELELSARSIPFEAQKIVEITYRNVVVARGKIDLWVCGCLVVEMKSVEALIPLHRLQTRSYLRIVQQPLGLLINFNVCLLKEGIRRVVDTDPT